MTHDKDYAQRAFRVGVLAAMDESARSIFGGAIPAAYENREGSTDADLPEIFQLVDAQLERLSERYNRGGT